MEDLVPAHHPLAETGEDGGEPAIEVGLERGVVLEALGPHERLDRSALLPLRPLDLVAADVPVGVGKERRHLGDEVFEEPVGLLPRGIEGRREDAEPALDRERPRRAGVGGITREPRGRMARHVELRHHPDPAVAGVGHDLADLLLGIEEPVGALLLEQRETPALHPEALVLGEVPVEDVELDRGHSVELPLDRLGRLPVPADVDQETAPGEAGPVGDADGGNPPPGRVALHQLEHGLEAAERADGGRRLERRSTGLDLEHVALVFGRRLNRLARALDRDGEPAGSPPHEEAGGAGQPVAEPGDRALQPTVAGRPADRHGERGVEAEPPFSPGERGRHRHEGVPGVGRRGAGRNEGGERREHLAYQHRADIPIAGAPGRARGGRGEPGVTPGS